ncbi:hypothetical protein EV359DRAFT_87510 [Lentinula novae-zelandiae]|nr:hypothetical protein EV359DRAFT_87510 [Lentinula novae-zelandiae]
MLHKLWDLNLSNVKAIPYVELCTASPLLPPPLEDARRYPHFPGPPSRAYTLSGLTHSRPTPTTIYNDPTLTALTSTGSHYFYLPLLRPRDLPGPSRSPFKGPISQFQPLLGHSCPRSRFLPNLKTNSDPGLTLYQALPSLNGLVATKMSATSTERPSSSKLESRKQKSALSRGNTTQAQKSNQAASSTAITVVAGQHLVPIPEQSFGDEPSDDIRTPEGRQPTTREPPPMDPGPTGTTMGPPQQKYASMGYAQPASSPMGGFAYSPTWGMRGPPPGPVPQLDIESASNAGGRVSGQVAAIERIQGENADPLTLQQREKLPERGVSPAASEQSRASSRRLPTPPSPAMNTPNWERTHAIHHSRTNFPVQPSSEMTLRLEDFIRIQECTPEDIALVLREVLELTGTVPNSGSSARDRSTRESSTMADDPNEPIRLPLAVQRPIGPQADARTTGSRGSLWTIVQKSKGDTPPPSSDSRKRKGGLH